MSFNSPFLLSMKSRNDLPFPQISQSPTWDDSISTPFEKNSFQSRKPLGIANRLIFMGPKAMANPISCWLWLVSSSVMATTLSNSPTIVQCFVHRSLTSETPSCLPLQILLPLCIAHPFHCKILEALATVCVQYRQAVAVLRGWSNRRLQTGAREQHRWDKFQIRSSH